MQQSTYTFSFWQTPAMQRPVYPPTTVQFMYRGQLVMPAGGTQPLVGHALPSTAEGQSLSVVHGVSCVPEVAEEFFFDEADDFLEDDCLEEFDAAEDAPALLEEKLQLWPQGPLVHAPLQQGTGP